MYCKYLSKGGEACSKVANEDGKYCTYHAERNKISKFHNNRESVIRKNWAILMEEIQTEKPKTSLAQMLEYLEYLCSTEGIYFSRDFSIDWYYSNMSSEGHPVEIVKEKKWVSFFHRYPYKKILENGFPKSDKEIIEEYIIKNPSATAKEISLNTKIKVNEIYQISKRHKFPISKQRDNELEISHEIRLNPQITEDEIKDKLDLDKFEIERVKTSLNIEFAREKTLVSFTSDHDENRIRKNLSFLYSLLSDLRETKLLNESQEELLIVLFKEDGDIDSISKLFKIENKRILSRLNTMSKQSSKLRDIIDKVKLGNSSFTTNSTDFVSEVHEPSFNELHDGPKYETDENFSYDFDHPFVRSIDLAKMAKFISFDYLRKYGYRYLPRNELVYLIRQEYPVIFAYYQKYYGKKHFDNLQFFRPEKPPKYSIDFISQHYTLQGEKSFSFDRSANDFLFSCLIKLKTEIYGYDSKEQFNPRMEGIYKSQFIIGEGYIKEKINLFSKQISDPYCCEKCGHYGEKSLLVLERQNMANCVPCKQGEDFLHSRVKLDNIELQRKMCPNCNLVVKGLKEIEEKFGFRNIGKKTIPQSWCRDCR